MGRLAEAEGESAIWQDLRMKLFIDPDSLQAQYAASPAWLKRLMDALGRRAQLLPRHPSRGEAAGHHPLRAVDGAQLHRGKHRRRHRERSRSTQLEAFYGDTAGRSGAGETGGAPKEPSGSNGFAIAPANTVNHRALLLINPHTSFFFRSELQMTSDEGLNAYGAATWGQFFIYQGFNDRLGWMHTSTGADAIDEYAETMVRKGSGSSIDTAARSGRW